MSLSAGWFVLVGGAIGAYRCATTSKFYRSDFANKVDCVVTEEDRQTEVRITRPVRWLLVALCVLAAGVGEILIQSAHNWNPFSS